MAGVRQHLRGQPQHQKPITYDAADDAAQDNRRRQHAETLVLNCFLFPFRCPFSIALLTVELNQTPSRVPQWMCVRAARRITLAVRF